MATFLLTLLVLFFVARFILPIVLRMVVGNFVKKQARRYGQAAGGNPFGAPFEPARPQSTAPGEVHVDYVPPREKPQKPKEFKGGDYVDFEEVK